MTRPRFSKRRLRCGLARLVLAVFAAIGLAGSASAELPSARGVDAFDEGNPRVEAELLIDAAELRPGQTVRVGVHFEMDPGWHIYWRNSGDSGLPTVLEWQADDVEIGPIQWPVPEVFEESGGFLTTYGYAGEVLLASEAVVASRGVGRSQIGVVADFVTCKVGCIPGRISLAREVPVTGSGRPAAPAVRAMFERYAARLPVSPELLGLSVEAIYSQSAVRPGDDFRAAIRLASCVEIDCEAWRLAAARAEEAFLPELIDGVDLAVVGRDDAAPGVFSVVLSGRASPDEPGVDVQRLRGLIPVASAAGAVRHVDVDLALPRVASGTVVAMQDDPVLNVSGGFEAAARMSLGALASAFALALLGGLVLNLMPCVLPILAIKVFHIAEIAHESRGQVFGHGAAYTAGVLASMIALATTVAGLRAAGTAVGWGFQFQEPVFVAAISAVLVVFALNLFGVFEVTLQAGGPAAVAGATGPRRSFFEGLLAVVLATPCTAPFLGTAVGFAFASPTPVIFAIFIAIGLGLAAPYALITLVPAWARVVPRPGAWMLTVRAGLGFSLIATVVWLLWVVGRMVGIDGQTLLMGYLVLVAFGVWIYGTAQQSGRARVAVAIGAATAAFAIVGLASLPLAPLASVAPSPARGSQTAEEVSWRPYDLAAIESELARGRPVFVDFTADWCITCKVNETVVLSDDRVESAFERLRVATFKADWTLYDERIRSVLASFGKAGVPMYLMYAPDAPRDPELLPELLTVDMVIEAVNKAVARPASG